MKLKIMERTKWIVIFTKRTKLVTLILRTMLYFIKEYVNEKNVIKFKWIPTNVSFYNLRSGEIHVYLNAMDVSLCQLKSNELTF